MKEQTIERLTDFIGVLSSVKLSLIGVLPNLITAFLILIIGIIFSYMVKWIGKLFIHGSVYLLPAKTRNGTFIRDNIKTMASGFGKILFFTTLFLFVISALRELGLTIISDWMMGLGKNLPNLIMAIFIIFFGWKLKDLLESWVAVSLEKTAISYSKSIGRLTAWTFFVFTLVIALDEIGISVSVLTTLFGILVGAVAGGIALTISLGSKSTISNILSCYQIQKFIKIGDRVKFREFEGVVEKIDSSYIIVDTPDKKITIPASQMEQDVIQIIKPGG